MIPIKYILSVLLYILLLPISTPAALIVSTWTRPDDLDWGGTPAGGGGRSGRSGAGASIFTNGNLLEWIGEQSIAPSIYGV